jgi:hypothetical protein
MDKSPDQFSLLKSHIDSYTKKDGTTVKAHETKAQKHMESMIVSANAEGKKYGPKTTYIGQHEQEIGGKKIGVTSHSGKEYKQSWSMDGATVDPAKVQAHLEQHFGGDESASAADPAGPRIEAYGVKGMKSTPWRKEFKSRKHLDDWMTKQDGDAEIHGTSEMEQSTPAAKPASSVDVQGEDRYEFTHGKKPGGKGSYIFSPHKSHDFGAHGNTAGEHYFQSAHDAGYTDAKAAAKKWAAGKGHSTIHVQT